MTRFVLRPGLLATAAALLVAAVAYIPMILSGHITRDSGVFLYTGMVVSRGGMPYVDSWDHKGPLLAAIDAAVWQLGDGVLGAPMVEGLLLFLGLAVAGIVWSRSIGFAATPVVLVVGVTYLGTFEGGNFTETWLFPFQIVAYSFAADVMARCRRHTSTRVVVVLGFVVGLALAAGMFTRVNNAVGTLLLTVISLIWMKRRVLFGVVVAVVVGIIGAALGVWLWSGDALRASVDQYVVYNMFYSGGTPWGERIAAFASQAQLLMSSAVTLAACVVVASWAVVRRDDKDAVAAEKITICTFLAIAGVDALSQMASGRPYPHYLVVAIAALAVIVVTAGGHVATAVSSFVGRWRTDTGRILRVLGVAAVFATIVATSAAGAFQWVRTAMGAGVAIPGSYQARIVDRVIDETAPSDRVLVHGAETWVLAAAQRLSATPITYSLPVEQDYNGLPAKYLDDLLSAPPALIVESPDSCGISVECAPEKANFAHLARWFATDFRLEGDVEGFRFWRRDD